MARTSFALGAVVLALMAGCAGPEAGGDEEVAPSQEPGAVPAEPGRTEVGAPDPAEPTGTIEGSVRSSAGEPLPNATVRLLPAGGAKPVTATLTEQATFTFAEVPVGAHRVEAALLGYETAVAPVTVREDSVATVDLVLQLLETAPGFNVSTELRGRITCYVGGPEANVHCRAVGSEAGREQRDSFTILLGGNATPPVEGTVTGVLVEASWEEPNVAERGANPLWGMTMIVGDPLDWQRNRQEDGLRGWHDPHPRVLVDSEYLEPWGLAGGGEILFSIRPTSPQPVSPGPRVGSALDIEFTALATVFYDIPPDPCWSPMKGATFPCP